MRSREFISENRAQYFKDRYADQLWSTTITPGNRWIIDRNRQAFTRNGTLDRDLVINGVVEWIAGFDPTPNKKYTGWLIREYATGSVPQLVDIAYLGPELRLYHRVRNRRDFPPEWRDIWRMDSSQLLEMLEWWEEIEPTQRLTDRGESLTIDDNDYYTAIVPLDEAAACYWGQDTRWCTSTTRSVNHFSSYNKHSPLLILIPKEPLSKNESYQLHFRLAASPQIATISQPAVDLESYEQLDSYERRGWEIRYGEFADESNQNIGLRRIFERFGKQTLLPTLKKFAAAGGPRLKFQIEANIAAMP